MRCSAAWTCAPPAPGSDARWGGRIAAFPALTESRRGGQSALKPRQRCAAVRRMPRVAIESFPPEAHGKRRRPVEQESAMTASKAPGGRILGQALIAALLLTVSAARLASAAIE